MLRRSLIGLMLLVAVAQVDAQRARARRVRARPDNQQASSSYALPNNNADCPANCRVVPWSAGSDQWNSGALPTYTGVNCTVGLTEGDGTTNNASAIQTCITNLSANQAAVLPAGIYYVNSTITLTDNKVLRGAKASTSPYLPSTDATQTTLKLGASGAIRLGQSGVGGCTGCGGTERSITSGYTKGSVTLTMAAGHGFVANNWISVFENGDSNIPTTNVGDDGSCTWCGQNNGSDLIQQFVQVTAVNGNDITISRPLYYAYSSGNSPGAKTWSWTVSRAGVENLRMNGSFADHGVFLQLSDCLYCWVSGVETYDAGTGGKQNHVNILWSHGAEIRDSYFHFGRSNSSDEDYGLAFFFWNSDHKIENNVLRNHRHSWSFEGGGEGIVVLYNYVDGDWEDGCGSPCTNLGTARTNHGAHPMFNLFEGNTISGLWSDNIWGSASHISYIRNWLWGDESSTDVPVGNKPTFQLMPVMIAKNQNFFNLVGNVLGITGKWVNPTWSSYVLTNTSSCADAIYSYGCDTVGGHSATAKSSSINHGNWDLKTNGVAYWDGGSNHTLKNSEYYSSKPSWYGSGCTWPPHDGTTGTTHTIPAVARYSGGSCS